MLFSLLQSKGNNQEILGVIKAIKKLGLRFLNALALHGLRQIIKYRGKSLLKP